MIETAKRIMTKEKIDKQKTGQSSATPFMKASQDKSKKSEKGVSFGALETKETIDRHSKHRRLRECPNALTDEESGSWSEDLDDSTWQMLSQDESSPFQHFAMQD